MPAQATDATLSRTFDPSQRARLDLLHATLAEPTLPAPLPAKAAGLRVRLAFDETVDLDLFVTDPAQESVYFANSPTRSGGALDDDRRCGDASTRVEAVHYPDPLPGRYRVGVDFHRMCAETALPGEDPKQGLYVVRVDSDGRVIEREGMLTVGRFEVIVLEFDVE
jgi:hypothetical protein